MSEDNLRVQALESLYNKGHTVDAFQPIPNLPGGQFASCLNCGAAVTVRSGVAYYSTAAKKPCAHQDPGPLFNQIPLDLVMEAGE